MPEEHMISRRHFILAGATAVTAASVSRPKNTHAASRALRIGYILPRNSQLGAGASSFTEEVAKRTSGRFTVEQFPDSTLGGDVELMKGVQLGSIDLAFVTGMGLSSILPDAGVLNIPFLFRSTQHAHLVLDGPIGDGFREQFAAKDMIMLAWGENGLRHITNGRHPIAGPSDLKGLRMRVPQSDVLRKGFEALGAEAASLPFPQLFEALRAGTFDGQENPIATIRAAQFSQVQKFLTLSGHAYDPAVFLMTPDAFDELSADDKQSFKDAAKAGGIASRAFAAQAESEGVVALRQAGMTVQAEIDRAGFASAMAGIMPEFEQKFGAELIQRIKSTA
jgi:tripartite ATP-independent transporter DctP family solute receptor